MIGAIVLEGFYVVYNREEKTIQFAQSSCNVIDPGAIRSTIQGNISLSGIVCDVQFAFKLRKTKNNK